MSTTVVTPKSSTTSTLDCFEQDLPQLLQGPLSYRAVQPSSSTTKAAVPPWCLLCKPGRAYQPIADDFLKKESTRTSILALQTLGTAFEGIPLDNESNLAFASTFHIIGPLLAMLQIQYGTKSFTIASERSTKTEDLGSAEKATRVDLVFRTKNENKTVILILEYKRGEQIHYSDFKKVLLPLNAPVHKIEKLTDGVAKSSFLIRNGSCYTKQVAMYAKQNKCKHIVLFNWDHILLFEFDKLQKAAYDETSAGKTAELTWVSEQRDGEGEHITKGSMRKALLGFALQAFREHIPPLAVN